MRTILLAVVVIPLACSPGPREPASTLQNPTSSQPTQQNPSSLSATPKKVDVSGYYLLTGDVPSWCSNIDVMELSNLIPVRDSSAPVGFYWRVVPLWGVIALKADSGVERTDFRLVNVRLDGSRLTFSSKEVDSISYTFAGWFVRLGVFLDDWRGGEVVLRGHLQKLKAGGVISEADVAFEYIPGD